MISAGLPEPVWWGGSGDFLRFVFKRCFIDDVCGCESEGPTAPSSGGIQIQSKSALLEEQSERDGEQSRRK